MSRELFDNVNDYWDWKRKRDEGRAASPEAEYIEKWVREKKREAARAAVTKNPEQPPG